MWIYLLFLVNATLLGRFLLIYLSVLMRNNEFSSHRAAREITPT